MVRALCKCQFRGSVKRKIRQVVGQVGDASKLRLKRVLRPQRRKIMKFKAWDKIDKRWIYDEQEFIPLMVTNKGVFKLSPHHKENLWILADRERFDIFPYSEEDYKEGN